MEPSIQINQKALEVFAASLLTAGGYSQDEASITAESLVLSNLMGHDSHGIMRVRPYNEFLAKGNFASGAPLSILHETSSSILANGHLGLGQVQMNRMLDALYSKLEATGTVTGTIVDCGHAGRLGEWVEKAASRGFAAFMCVNDNGVLRMVAPFGGKTGTTSTNPLAFAVPRGNGDIFAIDLSTSATAMGKMRLAHMAQKEVGAGLIQDHDGKPSINPSCLYEDPKGTILPFGGYKGFALSLMVDCLAAGLSGGHMSPPPEDAHEINNVFITLWNPAYFAGIDHMRSEVEKYLTYVVQSEPVDPEHPVRLPGDRAKSVKKERLQNGVPFEKPFWETMLRYAEKLGVDAPSI